MPRWHLDRKRWPPFNAKLAGSLYALAPWWLPPAIALEVDAA